MAEAAYPSPNIPSTQREACLVTLSTPSTRPSFFEKSNGHPPPSILVVLHSGTVYEHNIKAKAYRGNANILNLDNPPLFHATWGPYLIPNLTYPKRIWAQAIVEKEAYIKMYLRSPIALTRASLFYDRIKFSALKSTQPPTIKRTPL